MRSLPADRRIRTRYLSLYAVPEKDREAWAKLLSYHCNALSRESDLVPPAAVPGTAGQLLRIDLADYGWESKVWDKLIDPAFHVTVEQKTSEPWPGGVWPGDGKPYAAGSFNVERKVKQPALAPWLDPQQAAALAELTQSKAPIVRGEWFLWQTAVQSDRNPGYYDFLGIKDKKSFDDLVGFDAKLAAKAKRLELLEAVANSTVTLQPRRIGAFPAISGWYWQTFDSRTATDDHNPLRILNGGFKFDAQEVFGHLPNGLPVWGLFDDKGQRQDAAPDFVASDATAHGTDRRVHVGMSCVRCHAPNGMVNPVDGWARNLFQGDLKLQSPDYEKLKELRQKYLRDLEGPLEDARRTYSRAILQATGMKPAEFGAAYGQAFAAYDSPVSLERAARDVGLTPEEFQKRLRAYLLKTGSVDTVSAAFLGARRGGIGTLQYHEQFSSMMLALRGLQQP